MTPEVNQRLYRLVDREVAHGSYDMQGEWLRTSHVSIELRWEIWQVEKLTPKGFWVVQVGSFEEGSAEPGHRDIHAHHIRGGRHWINPKTRSRLRLAETKREAAELAAVKRAHHVAHAHTRLRAAERRLEAISRLKVRLLLAEPPEVPE